MPKVLLVDDEEAIRFALSEVMEVSGLYDRLKKYDLLPEHSRSE